MLLDAVLDTVTHCCYSVCSLHGSSFPDKFSAVTRAARGKFEIWFREAGQRLHLREWEGPNRDSGDSSESSGGGGGSSFSRVGPKYGAFTVIMSTVVFSDFYMP